jgi:alpha-beta hydrolase superfamily lysophospholipase
MMKESLGQFKTRDGKFLSFRKWSGIKDVIVYLHGIESNSGWFSPLASRLNEKGFTLYGLDRRGSGLNKEDRGDIGDYNVFLHDIDDALNFIRVQNIGKKIYLMGICWGALLAVNYIAKKKSVIDGLILLSPAIYRKVNFNFCIKTIAKVCHIVNPMICFKIPIKDRMFTSNRRYLDFIKDDKMRLRSLTSRFFSEILKMEDDLSPVNHRISTPILVLLAGHDEIVDNDKVKKWFERLESSDKTIKVFGNFHHVMPFEENSDLLIDFMTDWVREREPSFESQNIKD